MRCSAESERVDRKLRKTTVLQLAGINRDSICFARFYRFYGKKFLETS